ncbi:unnamed protein product [Oppiella nova]|uniref:C3H1-type domain-containing protein n=1 Tax=Oppiella nova TaxID=334625 RepID=A0A7R9QA47_9ACAR|nr:unnamed protein product [Oppiella nova]CAG2161508.1 unnamed protein product [Oppiella nova]
MDSSDSVVGTAVSAAPGAHWSSQSEDKPLRRLLESEDSSYDSDYENNDADGQSADTQRSGYSGGHHDEVSRTISDTLGQEFDEYITTSPLPQPTYLDHIISDPNYIKSVEFALKLGYTETQVQIALMKLGPTAGQNELLAELIKLGAGGPGANIQVFSGLGKTLVSSLMSDSNGGAGGDEDNNDSLNLRPIVIDGSNVAVSHGNKVCFSCMGIKICVDWFQARGHREIIVFVPMWRKEMARPDAPIKDQEILSQLEAERLLVFTPSRNVGGRRMVCYDDRYILKLAAQNDGIVVSNDNYRDLTNENPEYKKVVEERLLMYSFVNDRFMPPDDPLGRHGPSLNNFLRKRPKPPDVLPPPCPYGKKCTYGNKCKYYHPERGNQPHKSVTERLAEQARIQIQEMKARGKSRESSPGDSSKLKVCHSLPLQPSSGDMSRKKEPLSRTKSVIPSKSLPLDDYSQQQPFQRHVFSADQTMNADQHKSSENLHRKLQRQLTLNPNYDPRLQALQHNFQHHRSDHHLSPIGTKQQQSRGGPESHRQLKRLGSDGPTLVNIQKQNLLYVPNAYSAAQSHDSLHTLVTRNASAPDPTSTSQWPSSYSPSMARLNSTSDTRLNMTPPPAPFPNQIWSTSSGGLIVPPVPSSPWNRVDHNSHNSLTSAPLRPSSVPLHEFKPTLHQPTAVRPPAMRSVSPNELTDSRPKLYFHLSSIFPEEQVRTAMEMYPEETNPQNICAAIITMFPKKL